MTVQQKNRLNLATAITIGLSVLGVLAGVAKASFASSSDMAAVQVQIVDHQRQLDAQALQLRDIQNGIRLANLKLDDLRQEKSR